MEKTLSDLMFRRFTFLDGLDINLPRSRKQLDFLRFYVNDYAIQRYGTPFNEGLVRDNPNMEPTEFENVFKMTDGKHSLWVYCLPNCSPVSVLRWGKVKITEGGKVVEKIEICIYGKALALYYGGHLSRLRDFVDRFQGKCTRADYCYDIPCDLVGEKYPGDVFTDLKVSAIFPYSDRDGISTVYYGKKHSPMFIRVYDKTEDLRVNDKNSHSFIYPKWYLDKCRRIEFEFKGRYADLVSPLEWLESKKRDFIIKPIEQTKRNTYKTLGYSCINLISELNYSNGEKIKILQNMKELINNKLNNLYHNKI